MTKVALDVPNLFGTSFWPPMPVFLISTIDARDIPNVAPFTIVLFASYTNIGPIDDKIGPSIVSPKLIAFGVGGGTGKSFCRKRGKMTFQNIMETQQFVVNVPSTELVREINICSWWIKDRRRRSENTKFRVSGLTPIPSLKVRAPSVKECKIHYECELMKFDDYGGQMDLFWGKVVAARADEEIVKAPTKERMKLIDPVFHYASSPNGGDFYDLGKHLRQEMLENNMA
jgi:flavin reductase (DIM6/NTAB) family NADH-FMN oxidoreductase RutF